MKTCSKCKEPKEWVEFHNANRNYDGKDSYCKSCRKEVSKKYNDRNRERIRAYNREYRREQAKEKQAIWGKRGWLEPNLDLPKKEEVAPRYDLEGYENEKGYIYLIKDNTFTHQIKIGKSQNPEERMKRITGQLPIEVDLKLIFHKEVEDVHKKERIMQMFFHDKRKKGEWFELNDDDIHYAKEFLNGKIKLGFYENKRMARKGVQM